MLDIKNLKVSLEEEDKAILKGVDLSVKAGEVHAVMGPERLRQIDSVLRSLGP